MRKSFSYYTIMKQPSQQPVQVDNDQPEFNQHNATHQAATGANGDATPLLGQAKQWLNQGSLPDLLGKFPQSVKGIGTQAVGGFNRLSTTQKAIGGTLLLLGVGALLRGGKSKRRNNQADTLNELLYFVNDRIEGYKRAVAESQDTQLHNYYQQLVIESERFSKQLNEHLRRLGGERQTSTTLKGKVYRRFMAVASQVTGHDEKAILASNIHGEQWAIKAYEEALADHTLTGTLRLDVERQFAQSQKTYEHLKKLEAQQ